MKKIIYYFLVLGFISIACTSNKHAITKRPKPTNEEIDKRVREINEKYHITIYVTDYDSVTYESHKHLESRVKKLIKEGIILTHKGDSILLEDTK